MTGASDRHVTVSLNLASSLRDHSRGSGCRVDLSDMKAKVIVVRDRSENTIACKD